MKQRFTSALIMLPLLILLIVRGIPLYIGGAVLMLIALYEFYSAFENIDYKPIKFLGYSFAVFVFFGKKCKKSPPGGASCLRKGG